MKNIVVIGSISTDFIVETKVIPIEGETVIGDNFSIMFGGKGANQAIATARLGMNTTMIGCVGNDNYGEIILNNFKDNSVNVESIATKENCTTGSAIITVMNGDNRIIIVEGANKQVTIEQVKEHQSIILASDLVIIQQEIPEETVEYLIEYCSENKKDIILNPAPARPIKRHLIDQLTYIIPNELEFEVTFPNMTRTEALEKYPNKLIITLGEEGAVYYDGTKEVLVQACKCTAIDTTGAGDCFVAAFATAIQSSFSINEAIRFACIASSIAIQHLGAQGGMPTLEEMRKHDDFKQEWNNKIN